MTSPEQSNAEGPIAPWRHGSPSCCFAIRMICWDSAVGWAAETVVAGASDRMTAPARATVMIVRAPKDRLRNVLLPTNASLGGDGDVGEARTHGKGDGSGRGPVGTGWLHGPARCTRTGRLGKPCERGSSSCRFPRVGLGGRSAGAV